MVTVTVPGLTVSPAWGDVMVMVTSAGLGAAGAAGDGEGDAAGDAAGEAAGLAAGLGEADTDGLGDAAGEAAGEAAGLAGAGAEVGAAGAAVGEGCCPPPHAAVRRSAIPRQGRTHVMLNTPQDTLGPQVDQDAIIRYVLDTFAGVEVARPTDGPGAGDTFFMLPGKKMPFATIVTKDYGEFDNASQLDRSDVFRLNIGVTRQTFHALFHSESADDYSALDTLMPHPVYASQWWLCVLNPSRQTFEELKPLLAEAHARQLRS